MVLSKSERRHEVHAEFIAGTLAVYTAHLILTLELSKIDELRNRSNGKEISMHGLAHRQGPTPPPISRGLKSKAVLLLEPDLDLRLMLNLLLTEDGCTVDACGSLIEALLAVSEKHFDFVITHGTPGIDGLLLLDVLRERGSAIPCAVISARYDKEPYPLPRNLGPVDYFTTPLDYAALQRLIHART